VDGAWDDPKFTEQMLLRHLSLSEQAIQANASDPASSAATGSSAEKSTTIELVIWPESTMNFEYDRDSALRRKLAEFTQRNRIFLLINTWGFPQTADHSEALHNSTVLVSPEGEKIAEYDKNALVPFGEYIPARNWLPFLSDVKALVGEITPGNSLTLSEVAGARLGTLICFETTRPDLARRMRRDGASSIVQLSNEAWFGPTSAPKQMLTTAVFRAVENNVEVIRAANTGFAARIDRYGIVHGETPMFETATRTWKVKTVNEASSDGLTFYTRHGDVFVIACVVLSSLLLVASIVNTWRNRKEVSQQL